MFAHMNFSAALQHVSTRLRTIYEEGEANSIASWVVESITGVSRQASMVANSVVLTPAQENQFHQAVERLLLHEPVQYVLNEAWFCGNKLYVDERVLIPRPETEELVEWISNDYKFTGNNITILDIGTGSGCIPISLKKRLPNTTVWGADISKAALEVAKRNAASIGADIVFRHLDILNKDDWASLPPFDIIVSNPPYIPEKDKAQMQANVLQYEPAIALFVPDNDALLFYQAIAHFAKEKLTASGFLYVEIHEDLGKATTELLQSMGFSTTLKKDMQEKDRMIKSGLLK
jgi:release factor glutamine methyltransferase